MPSSELGPRRWPLGMGLAVAAAATFVLQAQLAPRIARARETEDLSLLPAPERASLVSLGFDAAWADALWAKLLVDYGTHLVERRRFTAVRPAIDTILALEPDSEPVFHFVDTLVLFQAKPPTEDDVRYVRHVLERGVDAEPTNPARWVAYAQYLAYLGPSLLTNAEEISAWEHRAAEALSHALELGAAVDETRAAARLFGRAGSTAALREYLERAYALASDEEKPSLEFRLRELAATDAIERIESHDAALEAERRRDLPGVDATVHRLLRHRRACETAAGDGISPTCTE